MLATTAVRVHISLQVRDSNTLVIEGALPCARQIFQQVGHRGFVRPTNSHGNSDVRIILTDERPGSTHVLGAADVRAQTAWVLPQPVREAALEHRS
jgi:hypothetical protein